MPRIKPDTPLMMLTVSQFEELMSRYQDNPKTVAQNHAKRYVYGLKGICSLFNCSHTTAQRLKDEVIKEAVSQNGRKIIVDADLAIQLFKAREV